MDKITVTFSEIDEIYETIDKMDYNADDYCPTYDQLKLMAKDFKKYYAHLVWIDETGYDTEENSRDRAIIRRMLTDYVEQTE